MGNHGETLLETTRDMENVTIHCRGENQFGVADRMLQLYVYGEALYE